MLSTLPFATFVFSTYVEVILNELNATKQHISILHVCGGDPMLILHQIAPSGYSPRMWR